MDEFTLINKVKQTTYRQPGLIKGIGDDAAVFREQHEKIVTAVDTFVEGVHFTKNTLQAWHLGYRLLAANISDVAAMGAFPKYYLVSIVFPEDESLFRIHDIYKGMKHLASKYNMDLIGGDTVQGKQLSLSLTIIGTVPIGKARYRHTAKQGDVVFVTGTLGDARAGLDLLLNSKKTEWESPSYKELIRRHRLPTPRVHFAQQLQRLQRVTLNDVSDGIGNELNEIATASKVCIEIDDATIPLSEEINQFPLHQRDEWKYFGGEDFELVGTVAEQDFPFVVQVGKEQNLRITAIGEVTNKVCDLGEVYTIKYGKKERLQPLGYVHRGKKNEKNNKND